MSKLKFTFPNILFLIGLVASILLFENLSFLISPRNLALFQFGMEDSYFFLTFSIAVLSYLTMIIWDSAINHARPNVIAMFMCVAGFICAAIGVMSFDGMTFESTPALVIDSWDKTKHILILLSFALTIYSIFTHWNRNNPSIRRLRYVFIGVILFCIAISIFSVIAEFHYYELTPNAYLYPDEKIGHFIKSIFLNSNMFAGMLLMGVASCIALNYFKKNVLSYIGIFGLSIIQAFVCSLAAVSITFTMVALYFAVEIFNNFKKKKKSAFFWLIFYLTILITLVILFSICQTVEIPFVSNFTRFLFKELSEANYMTLTNRTAIWSKIGEFMASDTKHLILGYGLIHSNQIIGGITFGTLSDVNLSAHNGFVQLFFDFGIAGLVFYGVMLFFYFRCLFKLFKNHTRFALIFLLIGLAYFSYAITESIIAFFPSTQGMLIAILFFLPVFNKYRHLKKPEVVNSLIEEEEVKLISPELMVRNMSRLFLFLVSIPIMFVVIDLYRIHTVLYHYILNAIVVLGISWLFVPYLFGLWAKKGSLAIFVKNVLIFGIIAFTLIGGVSSLLFIPNLPLPSNFEWFIFASVAFIYVASTIIYSFIYGFSFKLYLNTFVAFKTSLGSVLFEVGFILGVFYLQNYFQLIAPLTVALLIVLNFVIFHAGTFLVPFKDIRTIMSFNNSFDRAAMKKCVIKDRLEEPYEI